MIMWYEQMPDCPRLLYLLTMQNHGGWNMNDKSLDYIQALNNYGDLDETVDEYLSCIYLSDIAFSRLIEYFSKINRHVVICMVGDHSPYFSDSICNESYTEYERFLRLRSTPFIIWKNYIDKSNDTEKYLDNLSLYNHWLHFRHKY